MNMEKQKRTNYSKRKSGIKYKNKEKAKNNEKIKLLIDLKVLNISKALQNILELFDVTDIEVFNVELEEVIREIYEQKNNYAK